VGKYGIDRPQITDIGTSSGVLKTVTAASGTGHNIGTATSLQCGCWRPVPIWPHWREVAVPIL